MAKVVEADAMKPGRSDQWLEGSPPQAGCIAASPSRTQVIQRTGPPELGTHVGLGEVRMPQGHRLSGRLVEVQPLNRTCLSVGPLEVDTDQATVAQCRGEALVPQQPPHLVEPGPAAQPACCREVPQRVRV